MQSKFGGVPVGPAVGTKNDNDVEKQRARAVAQGLTFGFSDEIEALSRSAFSDASYKDIVADVRNKLKSYQSAYPVEATAYEIGGAALPALIPFAGQANLGRIALTGAAEGAAYGFGQAEGDVGNQLKEAAQGSAFGAVGGVIGSKIAGVAGRQGGRFVNWVKKQFPDAKAQNRINSEIQKMAAQSGRTTDEIVADVANGRIMIDDPFVKDVARGFYAKGGEGQAVIEKAYHGSPSTTGRAAQKGRVDKTIKNAASSLKKSLGSSVDDTTEAASRRSSEAATKKAERLAYSQFKDATAPKEISDAMENALIQAPEAVEGLNKIAPTIGLGRNRFFEIGDDGVARLTRQPTIKEAEMLRKRINKMASKEYRSGDGDIGEAYSAVEDGLRDALDEFAPELNDVRTKAAFIRAERDAYELGEKSLLGDVNDKVVDFQNLLTKPDSDKLVEGYRAGLMKTLENKLGKTSRSSLVRDLSDPDLNYGKLLKEVYPKDSVSDVVWKLETAKMARDAASDITRNSRTPFTQEAIKRQGAAIAMDVAEGMNYNPMALARVARDIADKLFPKGLTDAERGSIAKILVSESPDVVRRALSDDGGIRALTENAIEAFYTIQRGARRSGTASGAQITEDSK